MNTFQKMEVKNQWGHLTYLHDGQNVGQHFVACRVRWPDDSITWERVHWIERPYTTSDMGHTYRGTNMVPVIRPVLRGMELELDLDEFPIDELRWDPWAP